MKERNKVLLILGLAAVTNAYAYLNSLRVENSGKELVITHTGNFERKLSKKTDYFIPHVYQLRIGENSSGKNFACIDFNANPFYAKYNPFWARDYSTGEASENTTFSELFLNYEINGHFKIKEFLTPERISGEICLEQR